jgi:hypothetical protein
MLVTQRRARVSISWVNAARTASATGARSVTSARSNLSREGRRLRTIAAYAARKNQPEGFKVELPSLIPLPVYATRDWRANFFPVGIAHSVVGGAAWEPTPWRAV